MQTIKCVQRHAYAPFLDAARHIYLAGNFHMPLPYPFLREGRAEIILCVYQTGDDGVFHWHPHVSEYEFVIEGRIGYFVVEADKEEWFDMGDMLCIPPGLCVKRLVPCPAKTLTVKIPSLDDKIHCCRCERDCPHRDQRMAAT